MFAWLGSSDPRASSLGSSMIVLTVFYVAILVLLEIVGRQNPNQVRSDLGYLEISLVRRGWTWDCN